MTERKVVFERAIRNPEGVTETPPEGWRFEYEDEAPKKRWRRVWYTLLQRWSTGGVRFGNNRIPPVRTYIVRIEDD